MIGQKFIIPAKFSCTFQLAIELGLPLKLDSLLNALNIGQRKGCIHSAVEDAELTLLAAIKMLWLKYKGLKNRAMHLCWYDCI